jgi:excinuclease ABC subunit C
MEGAHNFSVSDAGLSENDTLMSFLPQYYAGGHDAPKEILLAVKTDTDVFGQYLRGVYKKKIEVAVPQKGVKKELTEMAQVNAREYLYKFIERIKHKEELTEGAVYQLAELLRLHKLPLKMECYDISHISGTDKTASMTVFIGGEKQPALYRRFKIRVEGNDDFASMEEAVRRRLARAYGQEREDDSFSILPDLIVIDGGPGQLGRAAKALAEFGADVELISLAKREEEVYTLASNKPYVLPKSSLALRMLMRIRDEAHRFAVSYHRKLREKRIGGELEKIEGIGKVKRRALIDRFSSLENIKNASADELCETGGIDKKLAATIYGYFHTEEK